MQRNAGTTARVGIFGIGLAAYWPQFPGLQESILKHLRYIVTTIEPWAEVIDGGLVDTAQAGAALGDRFTREDLDLLFCFTGTYATSTQTLPVVQRAGVPVVILNLQPVAAMDYETADTTDCLANAGVCPVPELAGVFTRAGIVFSVVTGTVHDDERAWSDISGWCLAAGAARSVRRARYGMLGHTYPGMIDMSTDVGVVHAQLGAHVEILEMNDLEDRTDRATDEEVAAAIARAETVFEPTGDISLEAWQLGARVTVGLERLVRDFGLDGLAYYYRGSSGSKTERVASNMILGNTLLTAAGIPAAGEGDLKTAIAMKIMHELGTGGSFCEFASMDLRENLFLLGHDGPAHLALSDGRAPIRELQVFHGKAGGGLSVEMRAAFGPVTILGLTQGVDGRLRLIAAEGENLSGPVPRVGNSLNRVRFRLEVPAFMDAWCALGPTHHVAMALGHRLGDIRKVARLLGLDLDIVA
ncbi:MAG: L-fucose/L-arabinose isomerase family protein [Thermomicrobiales bacterium]